VICSTNLDRDARPIAHVGRRARLELRFEYRRGGTVLADAYSEPPLRIGPVHHVADAASVILVCTGPGVFAGDRLEQRVIAGPGARVLIQSQSALQVHPGPSGVESPAIVSTTCQIAADAEVYAHWDPVIPFAGSRLQERIGLQLASDARLYWADGLMAGRASRGERWAFASLDHELRLDADGGLQYLERYRLSGGRSPEPAWMAGGAHYVGTTLLCGERIEPETVERLQRCCADLPGVDAAVDLTEPALVVGRFLGADGPAWSRGRAVVRSEALARARGPLSFRR